MTGTGGPDARRAGALPPGVAGPLSVVAFVCELGLLVLAGVTGWRLGQRIDVPAQDALAAVLAVLLVAVVVIVWARWNAPRSPSRLPWPWRYLTQLAPFVAVALLAGLVGLGWWGAVLTVLAAVAFGFSRGGQDAATTRGAAPRP
ncbi:YrdB family protein [Cellulomonas sp. PSBB021]|uniref:YrdB family protein n=1 Tax=Cellulomonas sp. PSBB021 TaxID=2003551 RepID=UPI000B8D5F74|nr:YrdB family protein [Cellulomonas sp. PSBB021]ASR53861.1 hypothetical protein CBP52_00345 [Cellulomonas sp. PSBB021]